MKDWREKQVFVGDEDQWEVRWILTRKWGMRVNMVDVIYIHI
jgi:hypothetical protein